MTRGWQYVASFRGCRRTRNTRCLRGPLCLAGACRSASELGRSGRGDLSHARNEVAHPADWLALKKLDALSCCQPFEEEGLDRGGRGTESRGQALAVELCIAVERTRVA